MIEDPQAMCLRVILFSVVSLPFLLGILRKVRTKIISTSLHICSQTSTALLLSIYQGCMSNGPNCATVALALPDWVLSNFMLYFSQDGPSAESLNGKIGTTFLCFPVDALRTLLIFSFRKHPQLLDLPSNRLRCGTGFSVPQSHRQFQYQPFPS